MQLKDIPGLFDIRDLVPHLRGSPRVAWGLCPLPFHRHRAYTPSFSVYWRDGRQYWKCHGQCGTGGNVVDLVGYLYIPGYRRFDRRMYVEAAEILTQGRFKVNPPDPPPPRPGLPPGLWQDMLPPSQQTIEYALTRGLTYQQIEKFRIGTPPVAMKRKPYNLRRPEIWMAMPTFHHEELRGIKLRNTTRNGLRYLAVAGSRKGLFNYDAVFLTSKPVLVVKGEIAAIVADRFGFLTCAPTGGEGAYIKELYVALSQCGPIVVGDNDPDPQVAEQTRLYAERRAAWLGAELRFPPLPYLDIDEYLLKDTEAALVGIHQWISDVGNK